MLPHFSGAYGSRRDGPLDPAAGPEAGWRETARPAADGDRARTAPRSTLRRRTEFDLFKAVRADHNRPDFGHGRDRLMPARGVVSCACGRPAVR